MAIRYWVGGTGTWNSTSTANWSATSGGASGASAPVAGDTVKFDSSSGTSSFTVTVASGATGGSVELNNANAILNLTGSVTFDGELLLEQGRLNLNSYQLTIPTFRNSSNLALTIDYGSNSSSKIIVTAGNSVVWDYQNNTNLTILNATTTSTQVEFTYSGSLGTREIKHATNLTSSNGSKLFNMTVSAGSDIFRIDQSDTRTIEYTSGFSGQGSLPRRIFNNLILSPNQTIFAVSTAISLRNVDGGTKIIRSNGIQVDAEFTIDAQTYFLDSNLTLVSGTSTGNLIINDGNRLDTAGYNLTANTISLVGTTGPRIDLNNSTVTLTGTGTIWSVTASSVVNAGTSTIVSSNTTSGARTFAGGGKTYFNLEVGGSTSGSTFTLQGSSTFNIISSTRTAGYSFNLTVGTTQTVRGWTVSGSSGAVVNLQSSATSGTAVLALIGETYTTGINYLNVRNIIASPISNAWYIGPDSTINTAIPNSARGFFTTQRATRAVYVLTGNNQFTVPEDWNNSSNFIHIIGGGGGGAAGRGTGRAAGGGGGGGGYKKLTNQTLTIGSSISTTAGTGGLGGLTSGASGGTGSSSVWNGTEIVPGGAGGSTTATPTSTGGAGGAGATFTGGTGGAGSVGTSTITGRGGGGGGGAAGPLGNGGAGGAGFGSSTAGNISGGGGGGNSGGTAGAAGTSATGGTGGNNNAGVGGSTVATGGTGAVGGGGSGSVGAVSPGSPGIDILGGVGSGGGGGGIDDTSRANTGGLYGGGGGGGGVTTAGAIIAGAAGGNGIVVVEYTPLATQTNFLMLLN